MPRVETELATVGVVPQTQQVIEDLLNLIEQMVADQEALLQEVQRLQQQLDKKKKPKTTDGSQQNHDDSPPDASNHSSDKRRKQGEH